MFNEIDEIELALESVTRKKIYNTFIKVFRSSEEQFREYCGSARTEMSPIRLPNDLNSSMSMIEGDGSPNSVQNDRQQPQPRFDSAHLIYVKGLPWTATKQEILDFFNDIKILNGTKGIHFVVENGNRNDAFIQLATQDDHRLAIKCKGRPMGFSVISSKNLPALNTYFEYHYRW